MQDDRRDQDVLHNEDRKAGKNAVSLQIHGWKLLFSLNVVGSEIGVAGVVDVHEDLVHPPGDVGDDQADEE